MEKFLLMLSREDMQLSDELDYTKLLFLQYRNSSKQKKSVEDFNLCFFHLENNQNLSADILGLSYLQIDAISK